jgi:hypothetical protein
MNARTSWSAKADRASGKSPSSQRRGTAPDLPLDDLLDARFDAEGRLSQIGHGNRQRVAERLDPRPPDLGAEELERAVQKLSEGLAAIERQSRATRPAETIAPAEAAGESPAPRRRDFVTHSVEPAPAAARRRRRGSG